VKKMRDRFESYEGENLVTSSKENDNV